MKRALLLLSAFTLLTLTIAPPAHAKDNRGKEPKLAICKRAKLIFEDDFSGEEILWIYNQEKYAWKIVKKGLVSESSKPSIARKITPTNGLILECDVLSPVDTLLFLENSTEPRQFLVLTVVPGQCLKVFAMDEQKNPTRTVAITQLSSSARGPYRVVFEANGGKLCLAAFGKRVIHDTGVTDLMHTGVQLNFSKGANPFVAIDNVKCWEALPLDAPDCKEEKTADAKDVKPDEAKTAKADEPKEEKPNEEKPAVELGNALGKDAAGNPIAWDISDKGVMRSTDAGGNLTKVTLYGPGQMSARLKAKTLLLMGKGDVEITAGGNVQAVSLPGKATIDGADFVTLKAKQGTVQITDITAEGQ